MLTKDGDVRYGYPGMHRAGDDASRSFGFPSYDPLDNRTADSEAVGRMESSADSEAGPAADVDSIITVLYRMCLGKAPGRLEELSRDALSQKIPDPLKRELLSRSLLASTKPSADELTQIISELAPFDIRRFSKATRFLIEAEQRRAKLRAATPCVMICEPGNGAGCESSLVLLRTLRDMGHIRPLGVIANMRPSNDRARLVRGTLDALGLHDVPVGVGSNGGETKSPDTAWENAQSYITAHGSGREGTIISGHQLLQRVFVEAESGSITLLCISALTDAALFLRDSGKLRQAICKHSHAPPNPQFTLVYIHTLRRGAISTKNQFCRSHRRRQ